MSEEGWVGLQSWREQKGRKPQVVIRETLLVGNTGGEEMFDKKLAENQPCKQPQPHGLSLWECTLLHVA